MDRRAFLTAAMTLAAAPAAAQGGPPAGPSLPRAPSSSEPFAALRGGGAPHHLTPAEEAQRVTESPAPPGPAGAWIARAPLPIPRSEMAWAAAWAGRMHVVGGYGEGRVDRAYHHVHDPAADAWFDAAPLPRGANHVAVAAGARGGYAPGGLPRPKPHPPP